MIINGGLECGKGEETKTSANRMVYFKAFMDYFKLEIPANEPIACATMKAFDASSSGAVDIYWVQDYGYDASMPANLAYRCKIVAY
ncbi:MAG: hypothetical protein ACRC5V_07390 [Aeromonas sp.]